MILRRFEYIQLMRFTVSFITDSFHKSYLSEGAAITSSVSKGNVGKLDLQVTTMERDLSMKTQVNDANIWNLVPPAEYPILERVSLNLNACFGSTYLSESEFSAMKM
jgi:hypothetical protein